MQLEYAKDPIWANAERTMINLTVRFAEVPEDLPFTASPDDCEAHGRDIYAKALAGDYGTVAAYAPPPKPPILTVSPEELAAQARAERDQLLAATDWTQAADIPQATKDKWAPYRQALRDVTAQPKFPDEITWPVKPE